MQAKIPPLSRAFSNRPTRAKGLYARWRTLAAALLFCAVAANLALWFLAERAGIGFTQAANLSLRMGVLKLFTAAVAIHDPYTARTARLGPADWSGWPKDAVEPESAMSILRDLRSGHGDRFRLAGADIRRVSDRAADFAYQPHDEKDLERLRARYISAGVASREGSRIDELALLNNWVRRQWIHGSDGPVNFKRFNASDIFDAAQQGAQYWCQVASMAFIQIAVAMGHQARLLSLSDEPGLEPGRVPAHAVAEVWIDELEKWVVFDTDYNLYYVDARGAPLDALELHRALVTGQSAGISVAKGSHRPEKFDIEQANAQPLLLPYYRYFYVDMRNDWITNQYFVGHPKASDQNALRWRDPGQPIFLDLIPDTSDQTQMYWPLDHVEIRFGLNRDDRTFHDLSVHFKTITPNFDRFEVVLNGSDRRPFASSRMTWRLRPGMNSLSVRAVNALGRKGAESALEIVWDTKTSKGSVSAKKPINGASRPQTGSPS